MLENLTALLNDYVDVDPVINEILNEIEKTGILKGSKC